RSWFPYATCGGAGPRSSGIFPESQEGEPLPDRETIRQTLIELLEADTGEKHPDLEEAADLRNGLGLDSVDVVSIVSQIERRFRVRLTHQELETLVTVADVVNLL